MVFSSHFVTHLPFPSIYPWIRPPYLYHQSPDQLIDSPPGLGSSDGESTTDNSAQLRLDSLEKAFRDHADTIRQHQICRGPDYDGFRAKEVSAVVNNYWVGNVTPNWFSHLRTIVDSVEDNLDDIDFRWVRAKDPVHTVKPGKWGRNGNTQRYPQSPIEIEDGIPDEKRFTPDVSVRSLLYQREWAKDFRYLVYPVSLMSGAYKADVFDSHLMNALRIAINGTYLISKVCGWEAASPESSLAVEVMTRRNLLQAMNARIAEFIRPIHEILESMENDEDNPFNDAVHVAAWEAYDLINYSQKLRSFKVGFHPQGRDFPLIRRGSFEERLARREKHNIVWLNQRILRSGELNSTIRAKNAVIANKKANIEYLSTRLNYHRTACEIEKQIREFSEAEHMALKVDIENLIARTKELLAANDTPEILKCFEAFEDCLEITPRGAIRQMLRIPAEYDEKIGLLKARIQVPPKLDETQLLEDLSIPHQDPLHMPNQFTPVISQLSLDTIDIFQ